MLHVIIIRPFFPTFPGVFNVEAAAAPPFPIVLLYADGKPALFATAGDVPCVNTELDPNVGCT